MVVRLNKSGILPAQAHAVHTTHTSPHSSKKSTQLTHVHTTHTSQHNSHRFTQLIHVDATHTNRHNSRTSTQLTHVYTTHAGPHNSHRFTQLTQFHTASCLFLSLIKSVGCHIDRTQTNQAIMSRNSFLVG